MAVTIIDLFFPEEANQGLEHFQFCKTNRVTLIVVNVLLKLERNITLHTGDFTSECLA